ncbi:MAG: LysM peptidoglycan-binding domain-containing protein [Bacilli bacterium]|nr:LysM peptidoglycan-binding domain-containing protein [Bacilli bacterium]
MQSYTVKKGDTLYGISSQFGVSVSDIIKQNNLISSNLRIGQVLQIPTSSNTGSTGTYSVKSGDTLYGISNQFGVSVLDIVNLNNLNSTNLSVGQVLQIPSSSGTNPPSMFTYTIKQGDSLYNIAKRYETTVDEIIKLNNLSSINLNIGQKLLIPETGESVTSLPSYINYTVKKGDSLYSIAKKYSTTPDAIMKDNNLNTQTLSIGQNLKIRTTGMETVEECYGEEFIPVDNSIKYTVKKGDSLWKIAKQYNTSVDNIKNKNNLTSNSLSIGQVLRI